MPFADYKDFADCVSRNRDKGNPDAYCGSIKHKVEKMPRQSSLGQFKRPGSWVMTTTKQPSHTKGNEPRSQRRWPLSAAKKAFNPSEATYMHGRPNKPHSHTQIGVTEPTTHTHGRGYHSYGGGLDTATAR